MGNILELIGIIILSGITGMLLLMRRRNMISEFVVEPFTLLSVFMIPAFTILAFFPILIQNIYGFVLVYFLPLTSWFGIAFVTRRDPPEDRIIVNIFLTFGIILLGVYGIIIWYLLEILNLAPNVG